MTYWMPSSDPKVLRDSLIDLVRIIVEHIDPNRLAGFQMRQFKEARLHAGFPLEYNDPPSPSPKDMPGRFEIP